MLQQEALLRFALVGVERYTGSAGLNGQHLIFSHSRLLCVERGEVAVTIDGRSLQVGEGHLLLVPKYTYHDCICPPEATCVEILFDDDAGGAVGVPRAELLRHSVSASPLDTLAVRRLDSIAALLQGNQTFAFALWLEAQGLLRLLYARFLTAESLAPAAGPRRYGRLQQVVEHILSHLDERLTVRQLAALMCMNTDHFSRMFRRIVGVPPSEFILMRRMERAQVLLVSTTLTVTQVAAKVGVSSASLFSRQFARTVGCTPLVFRRRSRAAAER